MKLLLTCAMASLLLVPEFLVAAEPLTVSMGEDGVTVRVGDDLFARYLIRSGTRPAIWPLVGPNGDEVTRAYPLANPRENETNDHIHHRSMWIGYEGVNGVDFWHEPETNRSRHYPVGTVQHREFVRADSDGNVATVGSRNDWLNPSGDVVCHDQRLFEFRAGDDWRAIDCLLDMWSSDGPLEFGDSKEGFFATRVAGTMKVEAEFGGKIVNNLGDVDGKAWGKPAAWADYSGPVDGDNCGITIFSHPSNRLGDPRWHVRPYGLFAANPFGAVPFGAKEKGGLSLKEGEHLRLRYRVLLHGGNSDRDNSDDDGWDAERITKAYDEYVKGIRE